MKNFFCIGDHGLDPDDIVNAVLLARLKRNNEANVLGIIANYSPATERAKLLKSVLLSLGSDIPVGVGTDCNSSHAPRDYEFDFPHYAGPILSGYDLLITSLAKAEDYSVTLLLHSGLTDIAFMIDHYPGLLQRKLEAVYIMGGASWEGDKMVVDMTASNNKFDKTLDAQTVYDFFIDAGISLNVLTRHAAYQAYVTPDFYEDKADNNEACAYLYNIQHEAIKALWDYARNNPPTERLNTKWFSETFCDVYLEPDEEEPWKYMRRLSLYDPITTVWALYPEWFIPETRVIDGVEHSICSEVMCPGTVIEFISDRLG